MIKGGPCGPPFLVSGVKLCDVAANVVAVEMRVDFSGGDALVPQHLLNGAKVGAALYEVGGKRVPEGVWTDGLFDAGLFCPFLYEHEDHLPC